MRWRDLAYNAGATLLITVVAGILVWLLTREAPLAEKLRYSIQEIASIALGNSRIGMVAIKISNVGNKVAHEVKAVIVLPSEVEIREKQISMSSGLAGSFDEGAGNSRTLNLSIKNLAPGELLTVSMLVAGNASFRPVVDVKSADTVGSEGSLEPQPTSSLATQVMAIVSGGLLIIIPAAIFLFFRRGFYDAIAGTIASANNTAFILIQQGLYDEAKTLLERRMFAEGAGPYEFANLATATGLGGDIALAEKHFRAAEWWARSKKARAVIAYGRATLSAAGGKDEEAKAELRKAYALAPGDIPRYFKLSVYFAEASARDPEFKTVISSDRSWWNKLSSK